jgi:hypothetical protein
METKQNIGKWTAIVINEGKTPQIIVDGTFPTNGQKPGYHLIKNDPQGINPTELLLTLVFGYLVVSDGTVSFSVNYKEPIVTVEEFKTVHIIDHNDRSIANINVVQS